MAHPKQISAYLQDMNDGQSALGRAQQKIRQHKPYTNRRNKRPERARFKLGVYFLDGNYRSFYSWDETKTKSGANCTDEHNALMKLLRLVTNEDKYLGKYKSAVIYLTEQTPKHLANYTIPIAKLLPNSMVINASLEFLQAGAHNIVNLDKLDKDYFNKNKNRPELPQFKQARLK
jgi:hypothetical protein